MKRLIQLNLLLLLISSVAHGSQNLVHDYDWKQLAQQHELLSGEIVPLDGTWVLKIENTKDTIFAFPLLTITNPPISKSIFAIVGRMKHENIPDGNGGPWQIQMKINYPRQGYFGRNFEFVGTSDWTDLFLSFHRNDDYYFLHKPNEIDISVALPPRGIVYLRHLQLIEYDEKDSPIISAIPTSTTWWSGRASGLIGGIAGSVIGCFGGLLGCLAGMGKARKFVLATTKMFIGFGILLTIAGLIAVGFQQPYAVWYALLLPGVILTLVFSLTLPLIQRRYDELEIRRMTSVDTMGS